MDHAPQANAGRATAQCGIPPALPQGDARTELVAEGSKEETQVPSPALSGSSTMMGKSAAFQFTLPVAKSSE